MQFQREVKLEITNIKKSLLYADAKKALNFLLRRGRCFGSFDLPRRAWHKSLGRRYAIIRRAVSVVRASRRGRVLPGFGALSSTKPTAALTAAERSRTGVEALVTLRAEGKEASERETGSEL